MLVPSWTNIGYCTHTMAHRQKYLAGGNPALTLEEAYWEVMSTITRVDDLTYECTDAGFTTTNQRLEADNLHRTLVDQNRCLNFIWRNEADIDKLYNTRELVQIIDEEILADVTWCMRRVVHVNKCCKYLNPILPYLDYITLAQQ